MIIDLNNIFLYLLLFLFIMKFILELKITKYLFN